MVFSFVMRCIVCGVYGFLTENGKGPAMDRLRRIALETETRGRHASGLAWVDQQGRLWTWKRQGAWSDRLSDLDRVEDAVAVIGHCRWATHGHWSVDRNNHPHRAGRGWIVHNGVVRNYRDLEAEYRVRRSSQCDTEVLGLLIERFAGSLRDRVARVIRRVDGPAAVLGLWCDPVRLVVCRAGKPLSSGRTKRGLYLASLPTGLPDGSSEVPDGYCAEFRPAGWTARPGFVYRASVRSRVVEKGGRYLRQVEFPEF